MTIGEVASYLKVSKETIYKMVQLGEIPGMKIGNQWRFDEEDLELWLKENKKKHQLRKSTKKNTANIEF